MNLAEIHQLLNLVESLHAQHMQLSLIPESERITMYEPEELSVAFLLEGAAKKLATTETTPSWIVSLFQVIDERVKCRIAVNSVYVGILNTWIGKEYSASITSQLFTRPSKLEQLVWVDFAALVCHDTGLTVHYWPETKQVRILTNAMEEIYSS